LHRHLDGKVESSIAAHITWSRNWRACSAARGLISMPITREPRKFLLDEPAGCAAAAADVEHGSRRLVQKARDSRSRDSGGKRVERDVRPEVSLPKVPERRHLRRKTAASVAAGSREVFEAREFAEEREAHGADRPVALLADDDFGDAFFLRFGL
jgi:hypothetical protein